jgi:hypothetical protein
MLACKTSDLLINSNSLTSTDVRVLSFRFCDWLLICMDTVLGVVLPVAFNDYQYDGFIFNFYIIELIDHLFLSLPSTVFSANVFH